jgi:hypothetical protein
VEPVNRRTFLKQAGVAAAAAGAVAAAPGSLGVAGATTRSASASGATAHEPELSHEETASAPAVIAHVRDAGRGEITLFVGEREITIHDRQVAARLVRATR